MIGEHSSKQYDQELEAIRSKVLQMGGIVEAQFLAAMDCFKTGNVERAGKVMSDDMIVNQLEVSLDDACSHLIVRRQPAANDLRTVMATGKVITDLERIGDEAVKNQAVASLRDFKPPSQPRFQSFNRALNDVFRPIPQPTDEVAYPLPLQSWLPGIQVLTARETEGSDHGLFVAAKGGTGTE